MKVGTIETLGEESRRSQIGVNSGIGSNGGNRSDDGGDNGNNRRDDYIEEEITYPSNKFRIAMFFCCSSF